MAWLWIRDAIAGAALGLFVACCACLPLIAPYGIADLTDHPGLSGRHHQRSIEP